MAAFEHILCIYDDEQPDSPAIRRAAWLASRAAARLTVLSVEYGEFLESTALADTTSMELARSRYLASAKARLDEVVGKLNAEFGIAAEAVVVWDHPDQEAVVRQALDSDADLVVKDVQRHSALRVMLLTNQDWQLIRGCPVPLWLVKRAEWPATPAFLAAIDPLHRHDKPAELDDAILDLATEVSGLADGKLHAFHAVDPRIAASLAEQNSYIPVSMPLSDIEQDMMLHHERRFLEVAESHGVERENLHMAQGIADEELPRLANQLDAAVVIMGVIARNPMKQLLIGSTAERSLNRLHCDLLIVKPAWAGAHGAAYRHKVTAAS